MNWARAAQVAALTLLATAIVIACSDKTDNNASVDDAKTVLRRANIAEPATLDPHRSEGVAANNILRDLYEGLVTEAADGELVPGTAKRWTVSDDGRRYTFELKETARWSNGDPVTAADFVAGFRRTVDPKTNSTYASMLAPLKNAALIIAGDAPVETLGIRALNEKTVEIELDQSTPYLLGLLLTPATYPLHRASFEAHGDSFVRPEFMVSNGAYRIKDWRVGDRLTAERNPAYWDNDNVAIDEVEYLPIEDAAVELNLFRAGEIDITSTVPSSQYAALRETYPDALHVNPLLGTYFLVLDTTQAPLADKRVRKALTMAVHREDISRVVLGSANPGAWSFVPDGIVGYSGYHYPWRDEPREAQLATARELYAAAGYSQDKPLQIQLLYNTGDNHRKLMVAVQEMIRQNLGAEVELINQEWKVMLQTRKDFDAWDLLRFGWNGDYQDAYNFLEIFQGNNPLNAAGWQNPAFDALLQDANEEQDLALRAKILRAAEAMLLEDYPMLPLYFYASKHLVSDRVTGFSATIMDRIYSQHMRIVSSD